MSRIAETIDTNSKWNSAPVNDLTSVMKSYVRHPKKKHTKNNHQCSKNASSCNVQQKLDQVNHYVDLYNSEYGEISKLNNCTIPDKYDITWRSFNQTVGSTITANKIPKKWCESSFKPAKSKYVPGKRLVRLSPSRLINSTQYDCRYRIYVYELAAEAFIQQETKISNVLATYIELGIENNLQQFQKRKKKQIMLEVSF